MSKYDNPRFDDCRKWIQKKRERGASWQELRLACKHSEEDLCAFLSSRVVEDDWPVLSEREWVESCGTLSEAGGFRLRFEITIMRSASVTWCVSSFRG